MRISPLHWARSPVSGSTLLSRSDREKKSIYIKNDPLQNMHHAYGDHFTSLPEPLSASLTHDRVAGGQAPLLVNKANVGRSQIV